MTPGTPGICMTQNLYYSVFQTPQKSRDVVMSGLVIEHLVEHPFLLPIVDDCKHTVRPLIEFIGRHVARKRRKCPVQNRAVHLPVRLFFPQPPSNAAGWQKAQT